jgi:hypothetical protein
MRIQAQPVTPPAGCAVNGVPTSSDGTTPGTNTITITGVANDTGPIAVRFSAGVPLTVKVSTPASCTARCAVAPALVNAVVQYKAQ